MSKLNTLNVDNAPQRILLYSAPKCGKSVAAGMLAQFYKVIFIDIENALSALVNNIPEEYKANIEYIKLNDSQDNPVAVDLLPEILSGKKVRFCSKHSKKVCLDCRKISDATYEEVELGKLGTETVVVIDSFTQLTDSVIGKVTEDLSIEDKLQFDHWGEVARRLMKLCSTLQVAPYHVVATSHEQIVKMPDGKEKLIPTLGSRNTSKAVGRYFDHLIRMEVRNRDFMSYSSQGTQVNALVGSRSNLDLTDPTTQLVDCLRGKVGKKTNAPSAAQVQAADNVLGKQNRLISGK